jgi:hypothetical protein
MMGWVARHPWLWWLIWILALAGYLGFMVPVWRSDRNESDRIALALGAMSVVGVVVAAIALKWTRDAAVLADKTWRSQILYEETQRLDLIFDAVTASSSAKSPQEAMNRVLRAMGGLGEKDLPETWRLVQPWGNVIPPQTLDSGQLDKASEELVGILDSKRLARASLLNNELTKGV